MPVEVIMNPDQITAEWLTRVLRQNGGLTQGSVERFNLKSDQRLLSANARLKLVYTSGSRGDKPEKLFLKMVKMDLGHASFGASEVNYYGRDYVAVPDVPIPRAYDARYSEELGHYHVLMEDLSESHIQAYQRTPTLEHGLALADSLAALHAHYWGRERLEAAGEPIPTVAAIRRFVSIAQPGVEPVIERCAAELKSHWPQAIREAFGKHPVLRLQAFGGNGPLSTHGMAPERF